MGLWDKVRRTHPGAPAAQPVERPPADTPDGGSDGPGDDAVPYGGLWAARHPGPSAERESWAALEARIAEALAGLEEGEFLLLEVADDESFVQFLQTGEMLVAESAGWTSAAVMAELGWQSAVDPQLPGVMSADLDPETSAPLTASSGARLATVTLRAGLGWRVPDAVKLELG